MKPANLKDKPVAMSPAAFPKVGAPKPASKGENWTSSGHWLPWLIFVQIVCQLALLSSIFAPFRIVFRTAAFGAGLFLLFIVPRRGRILKHPSAKLAAWVLAIVFLSILHPNTNTLLAGTTQAILYLAILSPLFWVPFLRVTPMAFQRLLLILWAFHSLSAFFGILQVRYPGRFQPVLSSVVAGQGEGYVSSLKIETVSGQKTFRPMGLTDSPGGAGAAGFYTVLLGAGFFLRTKSNLLRLCCLASMGLGVGCIYLSQVRSILIMSIICLIVIGLVLAIKGRFLQLGILSAFAALALMTGFTLAVSLAGNSVTDRVATLFEDNAGSVYYNNRGLFLEDTVKELIPLYPLGAGMGRWGMMNYYFGDESDPSKRSLWAEIQWTGWLYDGGIPLMLVYALALLVSLRATWRIASSPDEGLWVWGAVLVAYNIGAIALTFNYPYFISQSGMEFWLLNAALFAVAANKPEDLSQADARVREPRLS